VHAPIRRSVGGEHPLRVQTAAHLDNPHQAAAEHVHGHSVDTGAAQAVDHLGPHTVMLAP
jgi:hypothetical protein